MWTSVNMGGSDLESGQCSVGCTCIKMGRTCIKMGCTGIKTHIKLENE